MFNLSKKPKVRIWPFVLISVVAVLGIVSWFAYRWFADLTPADLFRSSFVQDQVRKRLGDEQGELLHIMPELLGFDEPRTYLFLFLNNNEMRPGGGFMGSYALITVENGRVEIQSIEGTENFDKRAPTTWKPVPPAPIAEHLGVDRWYFRDSNWSPDFSISAQKALELYKGEGGAHADDIDVVAGITLHSLSSLLDITGPVTVDGITFTADNVEEVLQYETSYGFVERELPFNERKKILKPFMLALMDKIQRDLFTNLEKYSDLLGELTQEKHVVIYSPTGELKNFVEKYGWYGGMHNTSGDYILWADANLAALKTDHAIERTLHYTINRYKNKDWIATARMEYKHTGVFDWRTSRYRTYARVFVPVGSKLVSSEGALKWDRTTEPGKVDEGQEGGKQWFGGFTSIEPGKTGALSFTYILPSHIGEQIEQGSYSLFAEKQIGLLGAELTLDLNFDKTIVAAEPAEESGEWSDTRYVYRMPFDTDIPISVNFK